MTSFIKIFPIAFAAFIFTACHQAETKSENKLSNQEQHLCDSLKIDPSILTELKEHTNAKPEAFHYSLSKQLNPDHTVIELDPIRLPGLVFEETPQRTLELLADLQDNFKKKGYYLFIVEQNFGIGDNKDVMAILKTTDQYEVIKAIQTNGANYDISNDSLIKIIKQFDRKYALSLTGTSGDWCEFKINKEPANWLDLAKEAYAICPDIVDQGTGTVEALAVELKLRKSLYLWWD